MSVSYNPNYFSNNESVGVFLKRYYIKELNAKIILEAELIFFHFWPSSLLWVSSVLLYVRSGLFVDIIFPLGFESHLRGQPQHL